MIYEEPVVVLDERTAHSSPIPEGVLEHHVDPAIQKRIAVHNLNQTRFLIAPDGKSAVSAEEIKSPAHERILEESLKTLLGERIEGAPYLAPPESSMLGFPVSRNFAEINAPADIKRLAEAGVKDFAEALDVTPSSHAARVR